MSFERVPRRVDSLLLNNFSVFRLLVEITAIHLWKAFKCVWVREKYLRCCCWKLFELVSFYVMFSLILRVYLTILSMCLVTMAPRVIRVRTEGLPVDGGVSCECTEWPVVDSLQRMGLDSGLLFLHLRKRALRYFMFSAEFLITGNWREMGNLLKYETRDFRKLGGSRSF
jgi:hypothetical protein